MPITQNNFGRFRGDVKQEMRRRLSRAVKTVSRHARELVSVGGPSPSRPGQPPHKQTGQLRFSIADELVDDNTARAGTNVKHGLYTEKGTRRMAPRPWLVRSLDEQRSQVTSILTAPLRGIP